MNNVKLRRMKRRVAVLHKMYRVKLYDLEVFYNNMEWFDFPPNIMSSSVPWPHVDYTNNYYLTLFTFLCLFAFILMDIRCF